MEFLSAVSRGVVWNSGPPNGEGGSIHLGPGVELRCSSVATVV